MVGAAYDLAGLSFSGFFGFLWFGVIYYLVPCLVCVIIVLSDLLVGCRWVSFVCVDLIVCRFVLVAGVVLGCLDVLRLFMIWLRVSAAGVLVACFGF